METRLYDVMASAGRGVGRRWSWTVKAAAALEANKPIGGVAGEEDPQCWLVLFTETEVASRYCRRLLKFENPERVRT
ncbi:hypothetical protein AOLI_G00120420 [Acnodon oligacanthus]